MSTDRDVTRIVRSWLHEDAHEDATRLLDLVLDQVEMTPQRRATWLVRRFPIMNNTVVRLGIAAAAVVLVAFLGIKFLPWSTVGDPTATPTATPDAIALEDVGSLVTGTTYTSNLFEPRVTFLLATRNAVRGTSGQETDICSPANGVPMQTSARAIVLSHPKGCVNDLRLIRPYAVDCGTLDEHPDAATLAMAILAKPGMAAARDGGTLENRVYIPDDLFFGTYQGRVIKIDNASARPFDDGAIDPDRCRLLAEPGSTDATIEVRGDMSALLLFLDVDGELVVLRSADGGYDAPTGAAARARGYGIGPSQEEHLLEAIYHLTFE